MVALTHVEICAPLICNYSFLMKLPFIDYFRIGSRQQLTLIESHNRNTKRLILMLHIKKWNLFVHWTCINMFGSFKSKYKTYGAYIARNHISNNGATATPKSNYLQNLRADGWIDGVNQKVILNKKKTSKFLLRFKRDIWLIRRDEAKFQTNRGRGCWPPKWGAYVYSIRISIS